MAASRKKTGRLDRPFAPDVLQKAVKLAAQYQVVVHFDEEEGEFYGRGLEMPLAMGDGKTSDACIRSTRQAMTAVAATLIERGEVPPCPVN